MFHHPTIEKFRKNHYDKVYAIFRIAVGLLFVQHGLQKLFGVLGGSVAEPFTRMWLAGVIELFAGVIIAAGLLTTLVASLSTVYMVVVYIIGHADRALSPIANRGELALLYLLCFLFIAFEGAGPLSVDAAMCKDCK